MHKGKRRIPLIVGMALVAMVLAFPVTVAARENHRTIPPEVLGAHVWNGTACDGTALSVAFHVTDRGRLVFDSAAGSRTMVRKHHNLFTVRFAGKHVRMIAWVDWHRGTLRLHTRSRSAECAPAPAPPVTDPTPPDDGGNGQTG